MLPPCLGGKVGCGPGDVFTKIAMWAQGGPEIDSAIQPLSRRANQPVNQSATQPPSHVATQPPILLRDPANQPLSHLANQLPLTISHRLLYQAKSCWRKNLDAQMAKDEQLNVMLKNRACHKTAKMLLRASTWQRAKGKRSKSAMR